MALHKKINLGKKHNTHDGELSEPKKNEIHYPSLYIHDLDGDVGFPKDMLEKNVDIKAVIRITDSVVRTDKDKTTTSLDIEVRSIEFEGDAETEPLQDAIASGLEQK